MNVRTKAILLEEYKSKDTGNCTYTLFDLQSGGQFRVSMDGQLEGVKPGEMLAIDAEIKPGNSKYGLYLKYVSGNISKQNGGEKP